MRTIGKGSAYFARAVAREMLMKLTTKIAYYNLTMKDI
jgi:hypothetical protein